MTLEVRDLTIDVADRRVVHGISFDVPDGARVGLITTRMPKLVSVLVDFRSPSTVGSSVVTSTPNGA